MKKILIATRNKDKFKIVSKLLSTNEFKEYSFYNLNEIENIVDKKESGDVINRSKEKAKNAYESIKNNDFEYIVGVDDFKIEENTYPLSHVLCPVDSTKSVVELTEEESNKYYYNYSKDKYIEVKDFFNDK